MKLESRQTTHAGVNFIITPPPSQDKASFLKFQEVLDELGIAVSHIEYNEQGFVALRQPKMPLQITVGVVGPHAGQLLIIAPTPGRPLDSVEAEAEDIVKAFGLVWPNEHRQLLASDVTIRDLYETSSEHAFKELWERKLGQSPHGLSKLGPSLAGGGLRFVLPPFSEDRHVTEVKIESYLSDSSKLFIEVQFKWETPTSPGIDLNPTRRLELVNDYISKQVVEFIMEVKE
ncbi:MAG: hypothetical protein HY872_08735 [Chloroflexi bacterium]|nr:hypothetical protein [Chloroflexota bacterium]